RGDTIYLCSDGYADQFGNTGKKLTTRKFKNELLCIQEQSLPEQDKHLENFHNQWKGSEPQTDDILVIGFRL
ncbi:MAG TPA: hypothetical protein VLB84_04885, partial [Bacteroidia bacterium]|nr:hypothetical protein [Bacteroidia bacterium]